MLGAVRFIPRDELPAAAAPVDGSDGKRKSEKSSKKRKHGSKEDRKGKSKYRDEKRKHGVKSKHKYRDDDEEEEKEKEYSSDETSDDSEGLASRKVNRGLQESKRKEAGLEWMNLAPERPPAPVQDDALRLEPEKPVSNVNELNPYWKNDGIGLPTEEDKGGLRAGGRGRLPPPPGVGDGGASWRMKALKRAQEQASREGRKLDEVVEERWGSLASLTNSVAVQRAAHANAHMHAKRDRTRKPDDRVTDAPQAVEGRKGGEANVPEDEDDRRIRTGSRDYLKEVKARDNRMREPQVDRKLSWRNKGSIRPEDAAVLRAAAQTYNKFSDDGNFLKGFGSSKPPEEPNTSNRVSTVMEYDELGPHAEKKKKKPPHGANQRPTVQNYNRIQTQTDRCQLCFDNVNRPKHLTMAIANFTYFTLPPRRPLVNGHCYIVPMQHEGATRNVDDDTWEELRNFKKCLVRMFDEQNKEAIFLETAMHLSRQKRHCVVECIPIPSSFAKDAPLYFKKAIDEAESEWSQHNAKRLIDTRIKGLRSSVPKNFPYFHVEFGMNGGYAHVIDDESKFKPEFGRAVLEGMLEIEEEDFHMQTLSRRDQEKFAKDFAKMWEPHDWTKMLE